MTDTVHPALAELFNDDHSRLNLQVQNYGLTIVQGEQGITTHAQANQEWTHRLEIELGPNPDEIFAEIELIVGHHAIFDELTNQCNWIPSPVAPNSANNGVCWIDDPHKALAVIATTPESLLSIITALQTNAQSWMEITVSGPFVPNQHGELRAVFAFAIINGLSRQCAQHREGSAA